MEHKACPHMYTLSILHRNFNLHLSSPLPKYHRVVFNKGNDYCRKDDLGSVEPQQDQPLSSAYLWFPEPCHFLWFPSPRPVWPAGGQVLNAWACGDSSDSSHYRWEGCSLMAVLDDFGDQSFKSTETLNRTVQFLPTGRSGNWSWEWEAVEWRS